MQTSVLIQCLWSSDNITYQLFEVLKERKDAKKEAPSDEELRMAANMPAVNVEAREQLHASLIASSIGMVLTEGNEETTVYCFCSDL